jgi:hypothetical protein
LVASGRKVSEVAFDLEISDQMIADLQLSSARELTVGARRG